MLALICSDDASPQNTRWLLFDLDNTSNKTICSLVPKEMGSGETSFKHRGFLELCVIWENAGCSTQGTVSVQEHTHCKCSSMRHFIPNEKTTIRNLRLHRDGNQSCASCHSEVLCFHVNISWPLAISFLVVFPFPLPRPQPRTNVTRERWELKQQVLRPRGVLEGMSRALKTVDRNA